MLSWSSEDLLEVMSEEEAQKEFGLDWSAED